MEDTEDMRNRIPESVRVREQVPKCKREWEWDGSPSDVSSPVRRVGKLTSVQSEYGERHVLGLFEEPRDQPWEIARRHTYYTVMRHGEFMRREVVYGRGNVDCVRWGCVKLSTGDEVVVRGQRYTVTC
jgi:hypothetical protein